MFVALAIAQVAKRNGSMESELCYLAGLTRWEARMALEQLDRMNLIQISRPTHLVATSTEAKIYLPSNWARGKSVEGIPGPRVASYVLNVSEDFVVSDLEAKFRASIESLLGIARERIEKVDEQTWQEYVRFARIVLSQIKLCSTRARRLYGEFMPHKIDDSVSLLLSTFDEIERKCETRQSALGLLERATRLLKASLSERTH